MTHKHLYAVLAGIFLFSATPAAVRASTSELQKANMLIS